MKYLRLISVSFGLLLLIACSGDGSDSSNGGSEANTEIEEFTIEQGQSLNLTLLTSPYYDITLTGCPAGVTCIVDQFDPLNRDFPIVNFFSTTGSPIGTYLVTIRVEDRQCYLTCITNFISEKTYSLKITAAAPRVAFKSHEYPMDTSPNAVTLADINGDKILDIITVNSSKIPLPNSVSLFLGSLSGDFSEGTRLMLGAKPIMVVVEDMNLDGIQDLVIALTTSGRHTVGVFLGRGDNLFDEPVHYLLGDRGVDRPTRIATTDTNGDGITDLVVTIQEDRDGLIIMEGQGDGTFIMGPRISSGGPPAADFDVGDLNLDGEIDIAVTNDVDRYPSTAENPTSNLSVILGDDEGFRVQSQHTAAENTSNTILLADFNSDSLLDALLTGRWIYVFFLRGDGNGGFFPAETLKAGWLPEAISVGDINGDSDIDLLVANWGSDSVTVMIGNGAGGIVYSTSIPAGPAPTDISIADFNSDGLLDFVVANPSANKFTVYQNEGVTLPL